MELVTGNLAPQSKVLPLPKKAMRVTSRKAAERRSFDGPISGPMWKRVSKLKSTYVDSFDWSVYDKLHAKFGDNQPRGGVVFGKTLRLVNWHSSCSKCHYALEIDTYGRGCVHNCHYCYAKMTLSKHGYWNRPHPMPIDLSELRKILHTVFETDKDSKWRDVLTKKIPLRIGSMSDSFMWMDRKYGVSLELLKLLNHYRYPYVIFTRSDLVAEPEYLRALNRDLAAVQFSVSGNNEELTRRIEPGAPSFKRRLEALRKLADNGFWTTVRVNPLFPTYPDGYFTNPEQVLSRFGSKFQIPKFPLLDIDRIDEFTSALSEAKVPSMLVGFARLSSYSLSLMKNEAEVDLKPFFSPSAFHRDKEFSGDFDKSFSESEMAYYYKVIQSSALRNGVRFQTCYIGTGLNQYFAHQDLWSNKSDCCDARGNVSSFKVSSQEISWETRKEFAPTYFDATSVENAESGIVTPDKRILRTNLRSADTLQRYRNEIETTLTPGN